MHSGARKIQRIGPGQKPTTAHYNRLVDALNELAIHATPPLRVLTLPGGGRCIAWDGQLAGISPAKTQGGGITGRSGTTPGSGTVDRYELQSGALADSGVDVTCYNISTTAVGATSYILMAQDKSGNWWAIVEPC